MLVSEQRNIAFVSDRTIPGHCFAIYLLPLALSNAASISDQKIQGKISSLKWSPNGRFVAFTSLDEARAEEELVRRNNIRCELEYQWFAVHRYWNLCHTHALPKCFSREAMRREPILTEFCMSCNHPRILRLVPRSHTGKGVSENWYHSEPLHLPWSYE